jgi:N utilization substance protein A
MDLGGLTEEQVERIVEEAEAKAEEAEVAAAEERRVRRDREKGDDDVADVAPPVEESSVPHEGDFDSMDVAVEVENEEIEEDSLVSEDIAGDSPVVDSEHSEQNTSGDVSADATRDSV